MWFDDIDKDEQDRGLVLLHRLLDSGRQLLEIIGEVGPREDLLQWMLGVKETFPVFVDQTLEDRLLGAEVVVEIAGRLIADLGDLAHRGRAVTLGREEFQRHLQHPGGGDLRPFGLATVGSPRHSLLQTERSFCNLRRELRLVKAKLRAWDLGLEMIALEKSAGGATDA